MAAGQLAQPTGRVLGHPEVDDPALAGPHRRAGPVGGQFQYGCSGQPGAPVGELAPQDVAVQPLALPEGEVGVLHRQRRQRIGPARSERLVQGGQFAAEEPA